MTTPRSNRQSSPALPEPAPTRQERQRAEIIGNVDAGRLHRAADLAHEHLTEFPGDRSVRTAVVAALERSSDEVVRRRAGELSRTDLTNRGDIVTTDPVG